MTVAKAMKSPGQTLKSPKGKGPMTPKLKSPKGSSPATPKGKLSVAKTPKGTPNVAKTPIGTPNVAKTPKGTPNVAKTSPGTKAFKETPTSAKTLKRTPEALNGNAKVAKTLVVGNKQTSNGSPKFGKRPKVDNTMIVGDKLGTSLKRKQSVESLPTDNPIFRRVNIFKSSEVSESQIKELLAPRGEIVSMKMKGKMLVVEFKTAQEARAAKKLNGVLLKGHRLSITHVDDKKIPDENKVELSNVPHDLNDEDVWSAFGSFGRIANVIMNRELRKRHVSKCTVCFEAAAGAKAALSSGKINIRGSQVKVSACTPLVMFPTENTLFIRDIPSDATEEDVLQFARKAGPVSGVRLFAPYKSRNALIYMTNVADVEKALKLNDTKLKKAVVRVERHHKASKAQRQPVKAEVPAKKQKMNVGAVKGANDDDVDDDEEDEDDDEEEDEDDNDEEDGDDEDDEDE